MLVCFVNGITTKLLFKYKIAYNINYNLIGLNRMGNQTINHFISIINQSAKLSEKEKNILIGRVKGKTLEEIGKKYKVTGERIRQKENTAIIKFMKKIYQLILFDNAG